MALKGDRQIYADDITKTCPSVAERGVVLVHKTAGSGVNLGDRAGVADLLANPSGYKPAGMLYGDMVDVDLTRYKLNQHKDETKIGNRCRLITKGRLTTNKVTGSCNPGDVAYLTSNGVLTATMSSTGGLVATPKVGNFAASVDENGFVAVDINLPIA
jgi:hypothetical protein